MGFSRQEIETRLMVVESQVNFILDAIKVQTVEGFLNPVPVVKTLGQLYHETIRQIQGAIDQANVIDAAGVGQVPLLEERNGAGTDPTDSANA